MQLAYDCCLYKSGIDYSKNIFYNSTTNSVSAEVRLAEFELKNIEYCLERVFQNIQTNLKQNEVYDDPTQVFTTAINVPKGQYVPAENFFYNYRICVDFLVNANNSYSKLMVPKAGKDSAEFPEFRTENLINNYFYRKYAFNILGLDINEITAKQSIAADEVSKEWKESEALLNIQSLLPFILFPLGWGASSAAIAASAAYIYINGKRLEVKYQDLENDKGQKELLTILKQKFKDIPDNILTENKSLPYILKNDCVQLIHQLILVLFRNFNVFIDFEDDFREKDKKFAEFKDNNGVLKVPNFVIKIGSLPREPVAVEPSPPPVSPVVSSSITPATASSPALAAPMVERKNCIKIIGFPQRNDNAEYVNGVYYPYKDMYKHGDHNNIYLKKSDTDKWQIIYDPKTSNPANNALIAESVDEDIFTQIGTVWNLKNSKYDSASANVNPEQNIKSEYIGALYMPEPGDEKIIDPIITPLDDLYSYNLATNYSAIGTIYKSIHHDFIYKYYNHTHKILFSDCHADYDVDDTKLKTMTDGMFPFIRLYKNNTFNYSVVTPNDIIYEDATKWLTMQIP
jgi:hypothetical protein